MTDTHTTAHIPDEAVQAAINNLKTNQVQLDADGCMVGVSREALDAVLSALPYLSAPCAVVVPTKEERHANTSRNLIINQTSTDLEQIINGHDPEQSILNNDVWDRLDKMACEIEALAKPVDVAAVHEQCAQLCDLSAELSQKQHDNNPNPFIKASLKGEIVAAKVLAQRIRALSAEPTQEDHIADVGKMVEAMKETRIDLVVLSGNIADAAKSSDKWEGMYDRVRSWIDRIDAALPAAPTRRQNGAN